MEKIPEEPSIAITSSRRTNTPTLQASIRPSGKKWEARPLKSKGAKDSIDVG